MFAGGTERNAGLMCAARESDFVIVHTEGLTTHPPGLFRRAGGF